VSITDRCNLRCTYCIPEDATFLPEIMSVNQIIKFVEAAVGVGVTKVRITGGEPLMRRELPEIITRLSELDDDLDIGLTTNGIFLANQTKTLYDAGLRRINVSLDTLDEEVFGKIARREGLTGVMEGLREAQEVGFDPIKINSVVMKGVNDEEVVALAELSREEPFEVRFIEFMPLDGEHHWSGGKVVIGSEILSRIGKKYPLEPLPSNGSVAPAKLYRFLDGKGQFGIIPSVSQPFCDTCNRVRLTADGKLRTCLFSLDETDFMDLLSDDESQEQIKDRLLGAVWHKEPGHKIGKADFIQPERIMNSIGG